MGELERTKQNARVKAKGCFYEHDVLSDDERKITQIIVGSLSHYLLRIQDEFLIAGIGGTLREKSAKDIDIGVVGFKYAGEKPADKFSAMIEGFFESITEALKSQRSYGDEKTRGAIGLLEEGEQKEYGGLSKSRLEVEIRLNTEKFSGNSKNVVVKAENCRPIQVHFFYNVGIQRWMKARGDPARRVYAPLICKGLPKQATEEIDAANKRYA